MFIAKKQNPIILLLGLAAVMVVMFMMLQNLIQQPDKTGLEVLPEQGNVWNANEELAVFKEKSNSKTLQSVLPAMRNIGSSFMLKERSQVIEFLSLEIDWSTLTRAPYRYIGSMIPFPKDHAGKALEGELDGIREFEHEGQKVWVYMQKPSDLEEGATYMDLVFLGPASHQGKKGWIGVASELHHFPEGGLYPMMSSDEVALNEVVDEMDNKALQREAQKVSSLALKHFFGKVQRNEHKDLKVMEGIGYSELMQQPDRYRGGLVEFSGSLIHVERKRLPQNELAPGMEFYYQGYLLNSDRILFLFRSLAMPNVELQKVLKVKGYFLQRYNFENKLKRATWVPLLVATDVLVTNEKGVELSSAERGGVTTFIILMVLVLIWAFFRTNKINKKLKVKKNFKSPKNSNSSVEVSANKTN